MICDLHNDFLTEMKGDEEKVAYMRSLGDVKKLACAVFTTELDSPLEYIQKCDKLIKDNNKNINLMLAIEDCGFLQESQYDKLIQLKPFYCGLTWNYSNRFAGGCLEEGGLSKNGEKLIQIFEKNGIFIDLAHLNEESFYGVAKASKKPLFCSHTACQALLNSNRNLKDEQIKLIVESGGLLGLFYVKNFMTNSNNFTSLDIAKHAAYIADKFGIANIALGSDFYGTKALPDDLKTYADYENLRSSLQQVGFNNDEIDQSFYKNFLTFLRQQSA